MKDFKFTDEPLEVLIDPHGRALISKKRKGDEEPEIIAVMGGFGGDTGNLADALLFAQSHNLFNLLKRIIAEPVATEEIVKALEDATGTKIELEETK